MLQTTKRVAKRAIQGKQWPHAPSTANIHAAPPAAINATGTRSHPSYATYFLATTARSLASVRLNQMQPRLERAVFWRKPGGGGKQGPKRRARGWAGCKAGREGL